MRLLNNGKKITNFMVRHPAAVGVVATGAAIAATNPLGSIQKSLLGNPHAIGNLAKYSAMGRMNFIGSEDSPGFSANIHNTGNTPGITTEGSQFSVNPDPDQNLRRSEGSGSNPSGAIVFGLYNNRLQ